jgi:hypothetical protein
MGLFCPLSDILNQIIFGAAPVIKILTSDSVYLIVGKVQKFCSA